MIIHKTATLLFKVESFFITSLLLLMPLTGYSQDLQKTPVRITAPLKINTTIKPRQVTAAGHKQPVCEGVPLPDIEAKNIRIEGSRKQGTPHKVVVHMVNNGQCATGKFKIKAKMRIQASGIDKVVQLGTKGARSLKPCRSKPCGESSLSVVFRFTPQYNHAFYDVTVDVDSANKVNEFRENNNQLRIDLKIQNY